MQVAARLNKPKLVLSPLAAMRRAVLDVLRRWSQLTPAGGETIRRLEEVFAGYAGGHALAVSSGTMALEVALRAAGVGRGDEVVLSAYDWGAAAGAVLRCGARPVFADVDPRTLTLSPVSLARCVASRTRAVVITHWGGCPADLAGILEVARRHRLFTLEDCAQGLGAMWGDRPVGSFGDAAAFSFGWGKLVSAGEGGVVVFRDEALWRRAVGLSQHPLRQLREAANGLRDLAMNARMHPLAAAMVLAQWELWPKWLERRRAACLELSGRLAGREGVAAPVDPPYGKHSFHRYLLRLWEEPLASHLLEALKTRGWPVAPAFPHETLCQRAGLRQGRKRIRCQHAEQACRTTLVVELDWARVTRSRLQRLARLLSAEVTRWQSRR